MKKILTPIVVTLLLASGISVIAQDEKKEEGRLSLKYFKKTLKKDSSEAKNRWLTSQVLKRGVTFEYTLRRENDLRKWGADEELISAIFRSIVDEQDDARMYRRFMRNFASTSRDKRKSAHDNGKTYLARFENIPRFGKHVEKVRHEMKFLECEFDPSREC